MKSMMWIIYLMIILGSVQQYNDFNDTKVYKIMELTRGVIYSLVDAFQINNAMKCYYDLNNIYGPI